MAGRVEDIESHSQIDGTLPNQPFSEEELKTMGVLDPSDTLFAISIFLGSQRGGAETFIEGYSVTFQNPSGEISEIKFLRKFPPEKQADAIKKYWDKRLKGK